MSDKIIKTEHIPTNSFLEFQQYTLNASKIRWVRLDIHQHKNHEDIEFLRKEGYQRPHGGGLTWGSFRIKWDDGETEYIDDSELTGIVGEDASRLQHDYDTLCARLRGLGSPAASSISGPLSEDLEHIQ